MSNLHKTKRSFRQVFSKTALSGSKFSHFSLAVFALLFAVLGAYFLRPSHAAPAAPATTIVGDLNNDNTVNLADLSIFLTHWQQSGTGLAEDFNNDHIVNLFDLSTLLNNWGQSGTGGTSHVRMGFDIPYDFAGATSPWSDLTQVDLFAIQTTNGTGLDLSSQGIDTMQSTDGMDAAGWVSLMHSHGKQALITIGGIADQNWENACNNTNRAAFVTNVINYMVSNGFDGLDLDIEDDFWSSQGPPSAAQTTCAVALATAAHAATTHAGKRPIVSEDITTPWMGPWATPYQSNIDQFNLMTYGETVSQVASDVSATVGQGLPASKATIGIDVSEDGEPSGGCAQYSNWAQTNGLAGTFVWDIHGDTHSGTFPCYTQMGP